MSSTPTVVRTALRQRSGGRCERCGQRAERLDAHHRMQRSVGGHDELHNLIAVCRACHDHIHADILRAQASGWLLRSWQDSERWPVRLFDGVFRLDGLGGMHRV